MAAFPITSMFDAPQISLHYDLMHYDLKIRLRKKFVRCSHDLFCVVVWRQSNHGSLMQAKGDLQMEKIRSSNDAWKGYLKTGDQ